MKIKFVYIIFFLSTSIYAQLGFCPGSKGDPIFNENFGNGTTYGPALPAGTTTYPFISGGPNDGFYTVFYHSIFFQPSWHNASDHTPDATNGPNGKMMIVNANAATSGDFYKKIVTGLCVNTTFEFSAWLLNLYNPTSNICVNQIPINVRFEIWNSTETVLLVSGNTGNIMGSPTPNWQQFALVFTTVGETSVVLKMKNNGVGGCGNDLAIDDISFSACGDLTTVSSPSVVGDSFTTCTNPYSLQLDATTISATPYFYQWQSSTDGITWTNILGATSATYITPNLTTVTYFRVKAAQDVANLSNNFCSTTSNVFTVSVLTPPSPAMTNGDRIICSNESIPALSVAPQPGIGINWYDAPTGGTLLQSGSLSYTPTAAGIFYAEAYNVTTNCIASTRTAVELTIIPLPNAAIFGSTTICSGNSALISFTGTPDAILTYTINGGANQTIQLNASGAASLTPTLTTTTTYLLVSSTASDLSTCTRIINSSVTITVITSPTATISSNTPVCSGATATVTFTGTPNAIVNYLEGGVNQSINLGGSGIATVTLPSLTATIVYTLIDVSLGVCTQTLTQSISLSAVPYPTATISANPLAVCSQQTSVVSFTGTPNAVVTYAVNGGPSQTTNLNGSGFASFPTSPLTSNTTYTLVSVTSSVLNLCSTIINNSITLTVSNPATASISSNAPVCFGNSATVTFIGTPNAIVTYTVNGGTAQTINLSNTGGATRVIPSVTSTIVYALISITTPGASGCTQPLSQSINVSTVPIPTASISAASAAVCASQSTTINFSGTPSAVVTYSINGSGSQFIELSNAGFASLLTPPLSVPTTYQLINVALPTTNCMQSVSGSVTISILPVANVTYSGDLNYCDGESVAIALSSNVAGTTFSWTVIQNGTTGATAGSGNQIAQTITLESNAPGFITYEVIPQYNGCSGTPVNINITVYPMPVPGIVDGVICLDSGPTSSQFYTLDTNLSDADHSFQWFFEGNLITGAVGNTYAATEIGLYTVIATSAQGCVSSPVTAFVQEMAQGESLNVQQSESFSENQTVTITVTGGEGPFSYQLDNSPFQASNIFQNVSAGTHTITVVDGFCTNLNASVTIIDYPKFFTPNGDGFNDTWNITETENALIGIFDRYGKLLKQISSDGSGWDGIYNGQLLPSTDYWFTIEYLEDGLAKTFKSHFSLKR